MKIGTYTYVFYPETFLINELCTELADRNHEVVVSTGLPNYESKKIRAGYSLAGPYSEKYKTVSVKRFPVFPRGSGLARLALNHFSNLFFGIFNNLRIPRVDVSFVFAVSPVFVIIPAVLKKMLTKTPVVVWLQDPWPETFAATTNLQMSHPVNRALTHLVRWIYSHIDLMLIQSEAYKAHLAFMGYKKRVAVVPNWAPQFQVSTGTRPPWIEELPKNSFLITFAGNIGKGQDLVTILDAAKFLQDKLNLHIVLVGDGAELENLRQKTQQENIKNIIFCGRKPSTEMSYLFEASSCLYVSLKADHLSELTIPSKLQAYMSSGKPILASLKGEGAKIVTESKCGLVATPGDSRELARSIETLAAMGPGQLKNLGDNAKGYYLEHFERTKIIDRIENLLEELVRRTY